MWIAKKPPKLDLPDPIPMTPGDGVEGPLSIHAMEIDEGPFRREIELPEAVDVDRMEATYSKGYLWITVPRMTTE